MTITVANTPNNDVATNARIDDLKDKIEQVAEQADIADAKADTAADLSAIALADAHKEPQSDRYDELRAEIDTLKSTTNDTMETMNATLGEISEWMNSMKSQVQSDQPSIISSGTATETEMELEPLNDVPEDHAKQTRRLRQRMKLRR